MNSKIQSQPKASKNSVVKKLFIPLMLGVAAFAHAQVSLGVRANALFNTSSSRWSDISSTAKGAFSNPKEVAGFNIGLSAKIKLPVIFIMPEIYYTNFKSKANYLDPVDGSSVELSAKSNRLDIPVMVGLDVIGPLSVFTGPVFSTNLSNNDTFKNFKEDSSKNFSVGYQFGANVKISKLIVNARYEGSFSKDQRKFVNSVTGSEVNYDNRPSFFMIGLGYQF
ncbi:outer membrane beta-barrel protein [Elizabethkingia meningoseptica]|uniref:outer membrane beta-barrel protein n=1 Tax=Elizabethkingia meningoseptica TaxID=238 RepID=UPI002011295A|nr:outer membrane beta-barrel protein [Elizabethkingia meningoseptica]MCL1677081.1 PorT family protein [Elizabethkingia meningoseptica]MCL1688018.1 PorT family protein [Elizabethkingia meningoseptica]